MGAERLETIVRGNAWVMRGLATVRDTGLPDAWVGAGLIRDLVWGELHGDGFRPEELNDVDVAFFDPHDLSRRNDERATGKLQAAAPDVPWEAKNQAAVHTWYPERFGGGPVDALRSIPDAVGTWPETATAVAVRIDHDDRLHVCAPFGLDDLLGGVWRRNPRRVSPEYSRQRRARQRPAERWPGVTDPYLAHGRAHILLACGVFGNISAEDTRRTIATLPGLVEPGGVVIWSRAGDESEHVRDLFAEYGFEEVGFVRPDDARFRVGVHRLTRIGAPPPGGMRMFGFSGGEHG